jgi:hypothetical protein
MSSRARSLLILAACAALPAVALRAQQPPPAPPNQPTAKDVAKEVSKPAPPKAATDPVERIKEEGLKHSQVMATLSYLTDVIGPRLTGSPNMKRANEWTRDKLAEWGLAHAHLEPWGPFGRGWTLQRFSAQVVEPQCIPLIAYPKAWSPGTDGPLTGELVYLDAKTESDFTKYKGQLKGAIVLVGPTRDVAARFEPLATRLSDKELLELADAPEPAARRGGPGGGPRATTATGSASSTGTGSSSGSSSSSGSGQPPARRGRMSPEMRAEMELARKRTLFLIQEGAAVVLEASRLGDGGTLFVAGASVPSDKPITEESFPPEPGQRVSAWDKNAPKTLPQVVVAKEHFNRLVRMSRQGQTLKVAIDLAVRFHDADAMGYNTVAEIPGSDLKDELVMLGGHMDSWHSGTGATDNAAGVAVALEAVRILEALKLKPRRTVRIALWSGEEEGLLGSRAYVTEHFGKADRPPRGSASASSESAAAKGASPPKLTTKPDYDKLSAYFNLDNGTGKVRGVYLQGNEAVRPIFRKWLAPFRSMGASTLSISNTGGTDHLSFDNIGLPGFQFIQDVIEYNTRTHHSNQDVYDRIQADDMKQASVIMAAFVYNAATADEKLPRKPRPGR